MSLERHDLGIAPLYLMYGRSPHEQLVILYIWNARITGSKFTQTSISRQVCCTQATVKKVINELVNNGILVRIEEHMADTISVNTEFIPDHVLPPEKPKKKETFQDWEFEAMKIWRNARGAVGPREMHRHLRQAVTDYGWDRARQAFMKYAMEGNRVYDTLRKFGESLLLWMNKEEKDIQRCMQGMTDMLNQSEQEAHHG